ncbi:MAG: hypothetical protein P8184_15430 [Calditrichia bacterium]
MSAIQFHRELVQSRIRNPLKDFGVSEETIEIRTDPLLGHHCRIGKPKGLDKVPADDPLEPYVRNSKPCFFCAGKVENQTPMLPADVYEPGRIQAGEALLFPNLSGFGKYSAVCIFSKEHYIAIDAFTEQLIFNALKACRQYFRLCAGSREETVYPTVNWNYLLPAGSSILHPHLQPFMDTVPTNLHRDLLNKTRKFKMEKGTDFWKELREAEREGPRFLFENENTFWFTPFAPTGFNEVNAIVGEGQSYPELDEKVLQDTAKGIRTVLQYYASIRHNSFNMTLFSAPVGGPKQGRIMPGFLKIATRPVFADDYRNDVAFFEKFHLESMIDKAPESVAEEFRLFLDGMP